MQTSEVLLPGLGPGTAHSLVTHRFGRAGTRPRVVIQAGLHADEAPGMLVASRLCRRLAALEAEGRIAGEILVTPQANPLGLGQRLLGSHLGRFDLADGGNFNRQFPALADAAADRVRGRLTADPARNVAMIRVALRAALDALAPVTPAERLKHRLLAPALDADLVLDLHCDGEAEMHLYTLTPQADALAPLARLLGARAVLLATLSGHDPFDEAASRPWLELAERFPGHPIPLACTAATVEFRGEADVDEATAEADAAAIAGYLIHRGAIAGTAPALPRARCRPTPLEGSEPLVAPVPGVIVYRAALGAALTPGDPVADILDPARGSVTTVPATTSGILYARAASRIAFAGGRLGKIAGVEPRRSGPLLSP